MNTLTVDVAALEKLRALCLKLPEAVEQEAWGDPAWRVRNRIFAMQKGNHAGGRPSLWVKAAPGQQPRLVSAEPARYFVPPYVGSKGWVGLWLDGGTPGAPAPIDWAAVRDLIEESYVLTAPKRLALRLSQA